MLIPMVGTTGKPTSGDIEKILDWYSSKKIHHLLVYPRSGCELEYLSEEWFEMCNNFLVSAKKRNMNVFLYDEFNWPSAQANGELLRSNPNFAQKFLSISEQDGNVSFAIIDGADWIKEGTRVPKTNILDPELTKAFIDCTHEKYYEKFKEYFGNTIMGIFTDEPSYYYNCSDKTLPYYNGIEEDYSRAYNQSLFDDLRRLYKSDIGEFYDRYYRLIAKRFKSSYVEQISEWCLAHGIDSTGHLFEEQESCNQVNGNVIDVLNGFTLPGMDEIRTWTTFDRADWVVLAIVHNAARKKHKAMAELFGLGPSDMSHSIMRRMICMTALHGVNHHFLGVAPIDARGNYYKDNWFSVHGYIQPWSDVAYPVLVDEANKIASFATRSQELHVAVEMPITLGHRKIPDKQDKTFHERLPSLLRNLVSNQWNYLLMDEGETIDAPIYIKFEESGFDVNGKMHCDNLEELNQVINATIPRKVEILDENGDLCKEVLLRTFEDGGFVAVDLREEREDVRKVCVKNGESTYIIDLYPAGVVTEKDLKDRCERREVLLEEVPLNMTLSRPNLMRVFAEDDGYRFVAKDAIKNVRMMIRTYKADDLKVYLDGERITIDKSATVESYPGFNKLYGLSLPFDLSVGEHIVTFSDVKEERHFLPLSILTGDFALNGAREISQMVTFVNGNQLKEVLQNYVGEFVLEREMSWNNGAYLRVNAGNLAVSVVVDEMEETILWAPYEFKLPNNDGKIKNVKIKLYTSIRPMFGDMTEYNKTHDFVAWCKDARNPGLLPCEQMTKLEMSLVYKS